MALSHHKSLLANATLCLFCVIQVGSSPSDQLSLILTPTLSNTNVAGPSLAVSWLSNDNNNNNNNNNNRALNNLAVLNNNNTTRQAIIEWQTCVYGEHTTCTDAGRAVLGPAQLSKPSYVIDKGTKYDSSIRVRVVLVDFCNHEKEAVSNILVPKTAVRLIVKDSDKDGSWLYVVLGPIHPRNISVAWGSATHQDDQLATHQLSWKRVEGELGHPGHKSNLLTTNNHVVRGLMAGTMYEICVSAEGRFPSRSSSTTCQVVYTADDVPGPAGQGDAWCSSAAKGTHWKCNLLWFPPSTPNGRITGYHVSWKDSEGYTLEEEHPLGTLCRNACRHKSVVTFLPHEGCVRAVTGAGEGAEVCMRVHDARSRLLAAFETKLLYIVAITLLIYILGPRLLYGCGRCCVRCLRPFLLDPSDGKNRKHAV